MVVATRDLELSNTAFGLFLVFNSINLKLFVSNLFVVIVVLLPPSRPDLIAPGLLLAFFVMFAEETLSVLGMWCCIRAPVGTVFRAVAASAFGLMALSMIVSLGFFLPQLLRQTLGGDSRDPTAAWTLSLALGSVAHLLFLVFLWRLARLTERPLLAWWPFILMGMAVLLLVTGAAAAVFAGTAAAVGVLWVGSSLLFCAHSYYLLTLRQAVVDVSGGEA